MPNFQVLLLHGRNAMSAEGKETPANSNSLDMKLESSKLQPTCSAHRDEFNGMLGCQITSSLGNLTVCIRLQTNRVNVVSSLL